MCRAHCFACDEKLILLYPLPFLIGMYYQYEGFGAMDSGYFVSKSEILSWINSLLHLNITKIETLGAGNIYCQILDVIFPGKVPLNKVNWKAKLDYEFINNLKILQSTFDKLGIKKNIEIQKIAKAKYQDNLELIQWFKRYYDLNCGGRGDNYLAEQKRGLIQPDFSFAEKETTTKVGSNQPKVVPATSQSAIRPKKMTSPYLGLERQTQRPKPLAKKEVLSRTSKKIPEPMHQEQKQQPSTKETTPTKAPMKSAHEQKLQLIGEILSKKDFSYEEKVKLIEEVMSL